MVIIAAGLLVAVAIVLWRFVLGNPEEGGNFVPRNPALPDEARWLRHDLSFLLLPQTARGISLDITIHGNRR
jgi:hypothetical protein